MRQPIPSGSIDPLSTTTTEYNSPYIRTAGAWLNNEAGRQQLCAGNGIKHTFRVVLSAAPGNGGTYTFTYRVNGAATALSVAITDPATSGVSYNEITLAKGDLVAIECTPSNSPTATPFADWSFIYEDTDDYKNQILMGGHNNALPTGATAESNYIVGGVPWAIITAGTLGPKVPIPIPGVLKDFYVKLSAAPGGVGSSNSYTLVTRINNTNSHSVTIFETATSGNDTTPFTLAAGDVLNIAATGASAPAAAAAYWGNIFTPDDANFQVLLGGTKDVTNPAATEFHQLSGIGFTYTATESDRRTRTQMQTLANLYIVLAVAPGVGNSQTFTVYKNGSATALSVTISDAATSGNNTSDSIEYSDDDTLSLAIIPGTTPAITTAGWGCTSYTYNQSNYGS